MSDITDHDRREALRFAETVLRPVRGVPSTWDTVAAARVILATVDAPAPTLADEIREWAEKHYTGVVGTGKHELLALADLAAQLEHDLAEARAEVERVTNERKRSLAQVQGLARRESDLTSEVRMLTDERDEAHAEVKELAEDLAGAESEVERLTSENKSILDLVMLRTAERDEAQDEVDRLTAERDRLEAAQHISDGSAWGGPVREPCTDHLDRNPETKTRVEAALNNLNKVETVTVERTSKNSLPVVGGEYFDDLPANIPAGEAWSAIHEGSEVTAVRKAGLGGAAWVVVRRNGDSGFAMLRDVTLLRRLVPAPRVITNPDELDTLAVGAIIRTCEDLAMQKKGGDTPWWYYADSELGWDVNQMLNDLPVTVLWEPEA
ncbi:hypothetical protein [Corynebacterium sp.]|uniref:hypothetical protein n=1 Tax=Corynebacterium sp. TaxID=1720 RepID=UPI0025C10BEE|nr:hypothetical protein [Corynebacterium sp.]